MSERISLDDLPVLRESTHPSFDLGGNAEWPPQSPPQTTVSVLLSDDMKNLMNCRPSHTARFEGLQLCSPNYFEQTMMLSRPWCSMTLLEEHNVTAHSALGGLVLLFRRPGQPNKLDVITPRTSARDFSNVQARHNLIYGGGPEDRDPKFAHFELDIGYEPTASLSVFVAKTEAVRFVTGVKTYMHVCAGLPYQDDTLIVQVDLAQSNQGFAPPMVLLSLAQEPDLTTPLPVSPLEMACSF